MHSAAALTA